MLQWISPSPPASAMAIAMRDSVTVSMSALNDRQMQLEPSCELRLKDRIPRQNVGIERRKSDVVVSQSDAGLLVEKRVRWFVKLSIEIGGW